jgi:DNA-binding FrmR family transcriptional regulator
MVCLAIIATLAILIYISVRNRLSDCELRRTLDQVLVNTRAIEKSVAKDRHVLNDAHKQISAVTKALQKQAS